MTRALRIYRPLRTDLDALEAVTVGRESILGDILRTLDRWEPGASRQHHLIIGPRGIGKTHLLQLIRHRIGQSASLKRKWFPVSFGEEEYAITKTSDLLLSALGILAGETHDPSLETAHDRLRYDDDDQKVIDRSLDALRRFHAATGCGLLLMTENMDQLLERQIKSPRDLRGLRKILIEEDWIALIWTSPTYLSAVTNPEHPFSEFFRTINLSELTISEQEEMLGKIASLEGKLSYEEDRPRWRSRLEALHHFTGGNPRLTVMLYNLVVNQRITEVREEIDHLLDEITPYYQDRMKALSGHEAKLVETMALMPEGCTPTELAAEARMSPGVVRVHLGRLEDAGYVRREERRRKRTVYIIPERFFRIWHLMGHSRSGRGRLQHLIEFFSTWYQTKEDRDRVWADLAGDLQEELDTGRVDGVEELTEFMEYIAAISPGEERYAREFDRVRRMLESSGSDAIARELTGLDRLFPEDGDYFLAKGRFLVNQLESHEKALQAFRRAAELKTGNVTPMLDQVVVLESLGRWKEARAVYKAAVGAFSPESGVMYSGSGAKSLLSILRETTDPRMAKIAAVFLGRCKDASVIDGVMTILRSPGEPWRRAPAAVALGSLTRTLSGHGAPGVVRSLTESLKDEVATVRRYAAIALGRIGSEKAVKPLIESLRDEESTVRSCATVSLEQIGAREAVPGLIGCLKDEVTQVRGGAASALGNIGGREAVVPLIECLKDESASVRRRSASALGRIGGQESVEALAGCLQDEAADVRTRAAAALGRMANQMPVPQVDKVVGILLQDLTESDRSKKKIVRMTLRAAFRSGRRGARLPGVGQGPRRAGTAASRDAGGDRAARGRL